MKRVCNQSNDFKKPDVVVLSTNNNVPHIPKNHGGLWVNDDEESCSLIFTNDKGQHLNISRERDDTLTHELFSELDNLTAYTEDLKNGTNTITKEIDDLKIGMGELNAMFKNGVENSEMRQELDTKIDALESELPKIRNSFSDINIQTEKNDEWKSSIEKEISLFKESVISISEKMVGFSETASDLNLRFLKLEENKLNIRDRDRRFQKIKPIRKKFRKTKSFEGEEWNSIFSKTIENTGDYTFNVGVRGESDFPVKLAISSGGNIIDESIKMLYPSMGGGFSGFLCEFITIENSPCEIKIICKSSEKFKIISDTDGFTTFVIIRNH